MTRLPEEKVYNIHERSFQFSLKVISYVSALETKRNHYPLIDQLIRASTSVGANLAEGRAASSLKDLIKFQLIALKSANETIYWLRIFKEGLKFNPTECDRLLQEITEISNILGSIVVKLRMRLSRQEKNVKNLNNNSKNYKIDS